MVLSGEIRENLDESLYFKNFKSIESIEIHTCLYQTFLVKELIVKKNCHVFIVDDNKYTV